MKNENEKIDFLLEKNSNGQLSNVNWGKLNNNISQRLNQARSKEIFKNQYRIIFKFAASIAAVILLAIFIKSNVKQIDKNPAAIVTLKETRGSAVVELLDSNENYNKNPEQSSCIIIHNQNQENQISEISRDEIDLACLL